MSQLPPNAKMQLQICPPPPKKKHTLLKTLMGAMCRSLESSDFLAFVTYCATKIRREWARATYHQNDRNGIKEHVNLKTP